jgi:hypothetical protein
MMLSVAVYVAMNGRQMISEWVENQVEGSVHSSVYRHA